MPAKRPPARAARPAQRAREKPPIAVEGMPGGADRASPHSPARYRVLSGGISTPGGAVYHGSVVTGDALGDAERVQKLLDGGSIEEVADGAD